LDDSSQLYLLQYLEQRAVLEEQYAAMRLQALQAVLQRTPGLRESQLDALESPSPEKSFRLAEPLRIPAWLLEP
jgi:hypothetical protein